MTDEGFPGIIFMGAFVIAGGILYEVFVDNKQHRKNVKRGEIFHHACECAGGDPFFRETEARTGHPSWVNSRFWCEINGEHVNPHTNTHFNGDGLRWGNREHTFLEYRTINDGCSDTWGLKDD